MKIGYYVQGTTDEAFVRGLVQRWCPEAELAPGTFRGSSRESFRREVAKALIDLRDDKGCDYLVLLTDSDVAPWREVKQREWARVPAEHQHVAALGVAERNIECWLVLDREAASDLLDCPADEIPTEDPSGFVKRRLGLGRRNGARREAQERVQSFVASAGMRRWIQTSESFEDFYRDVRALGAREGCRIPNELERP